MGRRSSDGGWWPELIAVGGAAVLGWVGYGVAGRSLGTVLWIGLTCPCVPLFIGRHDASDTWRTIRLSALASLPCIAFLQFGTSPQALATAGFVVAMSLGLFNVFQSLSSVITVQLGRAAMVFGWAIWFLWPVWLPQWESPAGLIAVHPLFVLNSIWPELGDWTHQPLAYVWLTRLGQDVPFSWPGSVWPAVLAYSGIGVVSILVVRSHGNQSVCHRPQN